MSDNKTWNHESILLDSISKLDAVAFALGNEGSPNESQMYGLEMIVHNAVDGLKSIKDAIDKMHLEKPDSATR